MRKVNKKEFGIFAYRTWRNMMDGKFYKKGEHDSTTKHKVVACRVGGRFAPDNCYIDYVRNLPQGTFYVDGE